MIEKILQHVEEQIKKFNYKLDERKKEEIVILYEMNHDSFDEAVLSLFIEDYIARHRDDDKENWAHERRYSVAATHIDPGEFELPAFQKTKEEFDFLYSMLGPDIPFSFLSDSQKTKLVASMYPMVVEAGVTLIRQGDRGSEMYILEEGEFDVIIDGVEMNKMHPPTMFGELALLHEVPRTATVRASKPSKVWAAEQTSFSCIRIRDRLYKKQLIREVLGESPELAGDCKNSDALTQVVAKASLKIVLAKTPITLQPHEAVVVFKEGRILTDKVIEVKKKEILRESFIAHTDLECAVVNLKYLEK